MEGESAGLMSETATVEPMGMYAPKRKRLKNPFQMKHPEIYRLKGLGRNQPKS